MGISQYSQYICSKKTGVNIQQYMLNINIGNFAIFPIYLVLEDRSQYTIIYSQYKYWECCNIPNLSDLTSKKSIYSCIFSIYIFWISQYAQFFWSYKIEVNIQ